MVCTSQNTFVTENIKNKKMKNTILTKLFLFTIIVSFSSCSSSKNSEAPLSLYKTEAGKQLAYASYDRALNLFECDFNETYVETDYGTTHMLIAGDTEAEPLVILPGLFGDASMWYPNAGELSKHFRLFIPDMPNYGGKSNPAGKAVNGLNDYKIWISQVMEHVQISKFSLMGISYSSWLNLALSREMPDKISSLILLDPSELFMKMNGGIAWKGFKYFMFFPNRNKYAKFLDWLGGGYTNPELAIWTEHMLDVIEFGSTKMFDVPQHRVFKPEELTAVKMPVLIMAGGKPILYKNPEDFKANALRALPHAQVEIIPGAGHGLNMEKPEVVNKRIIAFLSSIE
jgi:pimeloyl-ACP methyl ester carboxylesterase